MPFPLGEVWTYDPKEDLPFDFVVEINVPQVAAANMANRAGDLGPWIWILLCEPMDLASAEPTWFFMNVNNQSATAVGATTGKLIGIEVRSITSLIQSSEVQERCPLGSSLPPVRPEPQST